MPDGPTAEADLELRRQGYKESFVQEYDGIKVYHHQGRYQHLGPQIYTHGLSTNIAWSSTLNVGISLLMRI